MALVELKDGYREPTGQINKDGFEFKRVFVIKNEDTSNGMEYRIATDPVLPKFGDSYPQDPALKVSDIQLEMPSDLNFKHWTAEVTYKVPDEDEESGQNLQNGLNENLQISVRPQQYEVPFEAGYSSKNKKYDSSKKLLFPIESTTKEPLITSIYKVNTIIEISKDVLSFDYDWVKQFVNSTNFRSGKIAGMNVNKDQARMVDIVPTTQTDVNGKAYYNVRMSIEITDEDFNLRLMNKGFMRADPDDVEKLIYILKKDIAEGEIDTDTGDERIDEPAKLDLDSNLVVGDDAFYIERKPYKSLDWNVLDIPARQT